MTYAFSFAALTSILVHVWLWHRKDIMTCEAKIRHFWQHTETRLGDLEALAGRHSHTDLHNRLMQAYEQVSDLGVRHACFARPLPSSTG